MSKTEHDVESMRSKVYSMFANVFCELKFGLVFSSIFVWPTKSTERAIWTKRMNAIHIDDITVDFNSNVPDILFEQMQY